MCKLMTKSSQKCHFLSWSLCQNIFHVKVFLSNIGYSRMQILGRTAEGFVSLFNTLKLALKS